MIPHINNNSVLLAHFFVILLRLQMHPSMLGQRRSAIPRQSIIHQFRHLEGMQLGKPLLGRQIVRQFEFRGAEFRARRASFPIDAGFAPVERSERRTPCANAVVGAGEGAVQSLAGDAHASREAVFGSLVVYEFECISVLGFVPGGFDVLVEEEEGYVVRFFVFWLLLFGGRAIGLFGASVLFFVFFDNVIALCCVMVGCTVF
mmetsp:Transcript_8550/g.19164  ORF Transcript_8550/g.19164 Transcript_8550/m.19164 type:complete len:203 (+) Transcript_8550:1111-1719(+)